MSKLNCANLVIETVSPLAITSGAREVAFDSALIRDVNGLPMIPATAIAGVWSQLVEAHLGDDLRRYWFGKAVDKDTKEEQCRSRFSISNGVINDQYGQPVRGFLPQEEIEQDPVLKICIQERPYHRERVAINDRGVAKPHAKFDQIVLPKGLRFSIQIRWQDDGAEPLLALWNLRQMAFGSSTRNGLGQIKLVHSEVNSVDLSFGERAAAQIRQLLKPDINPTTNRLAQTLGNSEFLLAQLPLQALDNWRYGSGTSLLGDYSDLEQQVALISYSEPYWQWIDGRAVWQAARPVLCGSAVKGILAHRIAYHYRKHKQLWAEEMELADHQQWQSRPEGLNSLFGFADENDHQASLAGVLIVDDCDIDYEKTSIRYHNAIDRFTGGVRSGALYSEELLFQPKFTLKIWLASPVGSATRLREFDPVLKLAFENTIEDLQSGLLPFGASSGRGISLVEQGDHAEWIVNSDLLASTEKDKQQ